MSAYAVFGNLVEQFRSWRERAREADLLRSMSDRELSDLGLTRSDVERVIAGTYTGPRNDRSNRLQTVAPALSHPSGAPPLWLFCLEFGDLRVRGRRACLCLVVLCGYVWGLGTVATHPEVGYLVVWLCDTQSHAVAHMDWAERENIFAPSRRFQASLSPDVSMASGSSDRRDIRKTYNKETLCSRKRVRTLQTQVGPCEGIKPGNMRLYLSRFASPSVSTYIIMPAHSNSLSLLLYQTAYAFGDTPLNDTCGRTMSSNGPPHHPRTKR